MMHEVTLGFGTNLGDKESNILQAYRRVEESIGNIVRRSRMMVSEPWGFDSANTFVNSVAKVQTRLTPEQVLDATQEIERQMGRTSKSVAGEYHDRIIDIDILLYDDLCIETPRLTIPHPLMQQRDFVMIPLSEIGSLPQTK